MSRFQIFTYIPRSRQTALVSAARHCDATGYCISIVPNATGYSGRVEDYVYSCLQQHRIWPEVSNDVEFHSYPSSPDSSPSGPVVTRPSCENAATFVFHH